MADTPYPKEVIRNAKKPPEYAFMMSQLYRHFPQQLNDKDSITWKLCVPSHLRRERRPNAGHLGI